ILLESGSLYFTSLRPQNHSLVPHHRKHGSRKAFPGGSKGNKAFQLCSCRDGKLFVAHPRKTCIADYHICSH
ncbi:Sarcoglycan delta, partial [Caligus rogercresseyi]